MPRTEPNFILMGDAAEEGPAEQLRRRALRLLQANDTPSDDDGVGRRGHFASATVAAAPAPARAVAVGVVTMPAVFIVVVMIALVLFGKPIAHTQRADQAAAFDRLDQPAARPALSATAASAQPVVATGSIPLAEDTHVVSIALDGDRLALHLESPMGAKIVIYDFNQQRIVETAPLVTAAVDAGDSLAILTGPPSVKPRSAN
jgi:hypothetical protein